MINIIYKKIIIRIIFKVFISKHYKSYWDSHVFLKRAPKTFSYPGLKSLLSIK